MFHKISTEVMRRFDGNLEADYHVNFALQLSYVYDFIYTVLKNDEIVVVDKLLPNFRSPHTDGTYRPLNPM